MATKGEPILISMATKKGGGVAGAAAQRRAFVILVATCVALGSAQHHALWGTLFWLTPSLLLGPISHNEVNKDAGQQTTGWKNWVVANMAKLHAMRV